MTKIAIYKKFGKQLYIGHWSHKQSNKKAIIAALDIILGGRCECHAKVIESVNKLIMLIRVAATLCVANLPCCK